jgi:hypothetical protein
VKGGRARFPDSARPIRAVLAGSWKRERTSQSFRHGTAPWNWPLSNPGDVLASPRRRTVALSRLAAGPCAVSIAQLGDSARSEARPALSATGSNDREARFSGAHRRKSVARQRYRGPGALGARGWGPGRCGPVCCGAKARAQRKAPAVAGPGGRSPWRASIRRQATAGGKRASCASLSTPGRQHGVEWIVRERRLVSGGRLARHQRAGLETVLASDIRSSVAIPS